MSNASSTITNVDFDQVQVQIRYGMGWRGLTLSRGEEDQIVGSEGEVFRLAWREDSNAISASELEQFGCDITYGTEVVLGSLHCGHVPLA